MGTGIKILFLIVAGYFGILAILYLFQNSLIYFPDHSSFSPEQAGVPEMKRVEYSTADGLDLYAWYRPADPGKPTLVYFHGNAGNIGHRGLLMRPFLEEGYGVLLTSYRGYSGNPGKPSEEGLYQDARAALSYLEKQGVSEKCLVLYGNSIGAAVAVQMATEFPAAAIVLQSPFSSLPDIAEMHYSFFLPFKGLLQDQYNSLMKAPKVKSPVLVLHGKEDKIIPPESSQKLLKAFSGPKEGVYVEGKGHNDLFASDKVIAFIRKYVRCQ